MNESYKIIIRFDLGQKENFEYRKFSVRFLGLCMIFILIKDMEKALLNMSKYDTTLGKQIGMNILIYVSRQFWSFISSCIKRNNDERPNYHHIVKISRISLQIRKMKLRLLNQYPNTN